MCAKSANVGLEFGSGRVTDRVPAPLLAALADLADWLETNQIPSMIIGGVAASLLGRPRLTQDIDALAMIPENEWDGALAAGAGHGIVSRIENAVDFARRSRVLLLQHSDSRIDIDLTLGSLPFERDAVDHSTFHEIGGIRLRLPRVQDLLVMKAIAHRPKDLQDIEALLDAHPGVNLDAARQWIGQFAAAAAMPDLLEDFEEIVSRCRTRQ